jgi:hypothetical protein
VDRIKARVALFVVTAAVSGVFLAATPAHASDTCYPYPEQYCNTMNWVRRCVLDNDPWCQT